MKEQETRLTLQEHDDDDDVSIPIMFIIKILHKNCKLNAEYAHYTVLHILG